MTEPQPAGQPPAPRTFVGQIVDHYEILGLLGRGGFGEVWKARDTRLNRFVAIKRLPDSLIGDAERRERLRREALAASSLSHPNICTIHDFAEIAGEHLLVMEYIEGKTLGELLAAGPLPAHDAIRIALQIADALAEAHRHGIVHRDIKPANILLTSRNQVKVLDFGLARAFEKQVSDVAATEARLTREGVTVGTVQYISPEQLLGSKVDARSDLFSLGIVLYELLTGRLPFQGSSIVAISDAILHREPEPPSAIAHVPPQLDAILARLLAKSPDARYQTADEVHRDLSALVSSEIPVVRRASRGVMVWWSIAAVALIVIVSVSIPAWNHWKRVRWASDTAIPEISRLIENDRYTDAVRLAREVRSIVPDDPRLKTLWPKMTMQVTIDSTPTGADVFVAKYDPDQKEEHVGRTPLKDVAIQRGLFYRWRFEKRGFLPAYRVGPWVPRPRTSLEAAVLDRQGTVPPRTIHIPSGKAALSIPGLDHLDPVELGGYLIDQYEVTNADFKRFVSAGGYQKREYWKNPLVKGGQTISFEEAMATSSTAPDVPVRPHGSLAIFRRDRRSIPSAA